MPLLGVGKEAYEQASAISFHYSPTAYSSRGSNWLGVYAESGYNYVLGADR